MQGSLDLAKALQQMGIGVNRTKQVVSAVRVDGSRGDTRGVVRLGGRQEVCTYRVANEGGGTG
jgi:hypothetical protein